MNNIRYLIDLTKNDVEQHSDQLIPQGPLAGTTRLHSEANEEEPELVGDDAAEDGEPPTKRVKLSGAQRKAAARERNAAARKEKKGINKGRRFMKQHDEQELCWKIACGMNCDTGDK